MHLWHHPQYPEQIENLDDFRDVMAKFPELDFFHPNFADAPWHVQAVIESIEVNAWPHKMKAQRKYEKSVQGWNEVCELFAAVISEADGLDDLDDLIDEIG